MPTPQAKTPRQAKATRQPKAQTKMRQPTATRQAKTQMPTKRMRMKKPLCKMKNIRNAPPTKKNNSKKKSRSRRHKTLTAWIDKSLKSPPPLHSCKNCKIAKNRYSTNKSIETRKKARKRALFSLVSASFALRPLKNRAFSRSAAQRGTKDFRRNMLVIVIDKCYNTIS